MAEIDLSRFDDVADRLQRIHHEIMAKEMSDDGWDLRDELLELTRAVQDLASLTRDKLGERHAAADGTSAPPPWRH
jgi:hypothetical protein